MAAAARSATPWGHGKRAGYESFRDLAKRDASFAAAVLRAKSDALGRVESAIAERAIDGVQRPIFQRGELVGYETVYSDNLLLKLAQNLDPDRWTDRQKLEHSGQVEHRGVFLSLTPEDVMLLAPKEQKTLVSILEQIEEKKHVEVKDKRLSGSAQQQEPG